MKTLTTFLILIALNIYCFSQLPDAPEDPKGLIVTWTSDPKPKPGTLQEVVYKGERYHRRMVWDVKDGEVVYYWIKLERK